jgi:glutamyl/glutaminyl-tRNA synthetase
MNTPIYHTTSVIDDFETGVTHVIRGQEHTINTIRQILIQEAVGADRPIYAHIPLILNNERAKLSKRDPLVLPAVEYMWAGYLPEAILNFLALIGWNPGGEREIFSLPELVEKFDLSKVQKSPGIFNPEKLEWINKEHLKQMPEKERNEKILERLSVNEKISHNKKLLEKICPIIFDRISKWGDVDILISEGELTYFFEKPEYEKEKLVWRGSNSTETKKHLQHVAEILEKASSDSFENIEKIKSLIFDYAAKEGKGNVLWPLRYALSGKEKSPDPFTLVYVLGREESLARIKNAIML